MVYVQLFDAGAGWRRRGAAAHARARLAAVLGSAARRSWSARAPCGRRPRSARRAARPRPLADLQPHARFAGAAGTPHLRRSIARHAALSEAARRQAAGRQAPAASCTMTAADRLRARQHPVGDAGACRRARPAACRPVRQAVGRGELPELLAHPGSTAFLARVGQPPQIVGLRPGPARRRRGGDPHPRRAHGPPAARHRPRLVEALARAAKKAEARRLFSRWAAATRRRWRSTSSSGFQEIGRRKGYYEHAGAPAEDALTLVARALSVAELAARRCGAAAAHL